MQDQRFKMHILKNFKQISKQFHHSGLTFHYFLTHFETLRYPLKPTSDPKMTLILTGRSKGGAFEVFKRYVVIVALILYVCIVEIR